jgi:hypothetical protein
MSNRPSTTHASRRSHSSGRGGRGRILNFFLVLLLLPLTAAGVVVTASPASAAPAVSGTVDPLNGFPTWYQDASGTRVEQCLDPADGNCVLVANPGVFDPAQPVVFPSNFPDEFFYALADSEVINTPGCGVNSPPGKASVRLALEGAFLGGNPSPTDRMVFGRIRVKVTSGLCPGVTYQFQHPFGTETITANDAGAVTAVMGTEDIGCVPAPGTPCNFALATGSRIFGAPATGFLRWDAGAPAGYLGDGATLHAITGGTNGNAFRILDAGGNDTGVGTSLFAVAGKLAGSLTATPNPADFGGVVEPATKSKTITVTNVDQPDVIVGAATFGGADAAQFAVDASSTCFDGNVLARDASCTYVVNFTPTGAAGTRSATLTVPSTGGVRSPLVVKLQASAQVAAQAAAVGLSAPSLAFGNVRVREASPLKTVVVTNTGTGSLNIDTVLFDEATSPEYDNYRIMNDTCSTGLSIAPGATCNVVVQMAPLVAGAHTTRILITSNAPQAVIDITGTGTGGLASVSTIGNPVGGIDPSNGFPNWYMDEQGHKVAQCSDPNDPFCVVLPDAGYDPAQPMVFPTNFPSEFFYHVATSDNLTVNDPTCPTSIEGKAFMRSAIEGAFAGGSPAAGDQMTFGRIRFSVTGGFCPDSTYVFTSPYGADLFSTNAAGGLKRPDGTNDVGCFPTPANPCDFTLALSSRVLGGLVKWDPAVLPLAPAGYLGDAATLHTIVGAPYSPDGVNPANYFQITRADDGSLLGRTEDFTVMAKLQGPLEADTTKVDFGAIAQGSVSGTATVHLSDTGLFPLTISSIAVGGVDAGQFTVDPSTCTAATLTVGGAGCDISVQFSPSAPGAQNAFVEVRHTGFNDPFHLPLTGVGAAVGSAANISFAPRTVAFGSLHTGGVSEVETVTISNAGGTLPLTITDASIASADYTITDNRCVAAVPINGSCQIDMVFSPTTGGAKAGTLAIVDNAPPGAHSVALSGTGVVAARNVSAGVDARNGFPSWYQDDNGNKLEPCLDLTGGCVVLGDPGFNPANPVIFPTNFPSEFFYALADSQLVSTPGCPAAGIGAGTALLRVAAEGSFANGTPVAGDQITFGRMRVIVSGLCPNAPYTFVTPYGPMTVTTDAGGAIRAQKVGGGTVDIGSTPANAALAAPIFGGFPRWNPNVAPAAPAGYLGDGASFHKITGGTYVPAGGNGAFNAFAIKDSAGNELGRTDLFLVSGRVAGPLQSSTYKVDFGHVNVAAASAVRTVTLTNVQADTTITSVVKAGTNADQFTITGGTCAAAATVLAGDPCNVTVTFNPTTVGTKNASIRVTPASGQATVIALTGIADAVGAPAATVTPGVLAFGTRNVGTITPLITTVRNSGTAPLTVTGATPTGAAAGDYTVVVAAPAVTPPCGTVYPFTLAVGASCNIAVNFGPKANGVRTASLSIAHNAVNSPTVVSLSGTGVASSFVMSPSPVGFSNVNINTTKGSTISIRNSSTIAARLTNATITGTGATAYSILANTCIGSTLAAGKSCSITVNFRPTARIAYAGTLNVFGDSTTVPSPVTNSLTGTGR